MDDSQAHDFFPEEGEAQDIECDEHDDLLEVPDPLNPDGVQGASSSNQGAGGSVEGGPSEGGHDRLFVTRGEASILEVLGPGTAREARKRSAASARTRENRGVKKTLVPKENLSTIAMRRALETGLFQRSLHEARVGEVHMRFSTTHRLGIIRGFTVCWSILANDVLWFDVAVIRSGWHRNSPNLPTNIVDLRGFDSSTILILRVEFPRPIGDFTMYIYIYTYIHICTNIHIMCIHNV